MTGVANHIHPVCRAMNEGDCVVLRTFCLEMFDHELSESDAKRILAQWKARKINTQWDTSCGPAIWIKNRLLELSALDVTHNSPSNFNDLATAVLHCFFLSLEETAEMLAFLHNEDLATEDNRKKPARSKMFNSPLAIEPINGTAGKVAPIHERET